MSTATVSTRIALPKRTYERLKRDAGNVGVPIEQYLQDLLNKSLLHRSSQKPISKPGLLKLAELNITGGPVDLASRI